MTGAGAERYRVFPRLRVLLVDDDRSVRTMQRLALELDGRFQVVGEAADGAVGVRLASQLRPGAVVLDLMMPVMDGRAAARELRRAGQDAVVVLATATPMEPAEGAGDDFDASFVKGSGNWHSHLASSLLELAAERSAHPVWPAWERRGAPRA